MLKVGITPKVRPRPKAQQAQQAQQAQPKAQSSSKPHPGSIPRCGFYFSVRASSVSRFLDQKSTPSQPTGCERLLFPPEQSSKTSTLLNGFRVDGNKFRLNFSAVIYAEFD